MSEEEIVETNKKEKAKFLSADEIKNSINKKTGNKNAYNLSEDNPTEVPYWIPSRSRLLDSNICIGKIAGLPGGRISQIVSESGVGKSFLAVEFCKTAIDMNLSVVYFCSEPGGIEADFLEKVLGKERMSKFIYVEAVFIEEIFEAIDALMSNTTNKYLFVWDSLAATPTRAQVEGGFDTKAYFAARANVLALGLSKLLYPLSKTESTFLILNQVRENIAATPQEKLNLMNKFTIPGGKSVVFYSSLVLILFSSTAKSNAVFNENEERVGAYGTALFRKSRFGTTGRTIPIGFTWANDIPHFHDKELWFDALKERGVIFTRGPGTYIKFKNGEELKFKADTFLTMLNEDPEFFKKVDEMIDETFIINYKGPVTF